MSMELLKQAVGAGELRLFDVQFARQIATCNHNDNASDVDELLLAAALVSYRLSRGDTCVDLTQAANFGIFSNKEINRRLRKVPPADHWREVLLAQSVVQRSQDDTGQPADTNISPLLLDHRNRLYLSRYWHYERSMLEAISGLVESPAPSIDGAVLTRALERLYTPTDQVDWQRVATAVAALKRFCVITGGPGT
ncbi:MAG: hypothetical protein AAF404_18910, partial [Pseudomonadota bacterium]